MLHRTHTASVFLACRVAAGLAATVLLGPPPARVAEFSRSGPPSLKIGTAISRETVKWQMK